MYKSNVTELMILFLNISQTKVLTKNKPITKEQKKNKESKIFEIILSSFLHSTSQTGAMNNLVQSNAACSMRIEAELACPSTINTDDYEPIEEKNAHNTFSAPTSIFRMTTSSASMEFFSTSCAPAGVSVSIRYGLRNCYLIMKI